MEAVKAMKEGKKVRREGSRLYCYLDKTYLDGKIVWSDDSDFQPSSIAFFEATDWEIVEETKTLSDSILDGTINVPDVREKIKKYRDKAKNLFRDCSLCEKTDEEIAKEIFGEKLV